MSKQVNRKSVDAETRECENGSIVIREGSVLIYDALCYLLQSAKKTNMECSIGDTAHRQGFVLLAL